MGFSKPLASDRRGHDRHPIRTSAVVVLPDGRALSARTVDVGKGGAGVVCDANLLHGTVIRVRMNLPSRPTGNTVFEATAVVVNSTLTASDGGFRLGVQFRDLSEAAQGALKGFLP